MDLLDNAPRSTVHLGNDLDDSFRQLDRHLSCIWELYIRDIPIQFL